MEWRLVNSNKGISVLALLFFLLYALGATSNSSLDAWAYAANVSGGNGLFYPHHLLYCPLGYSWVAAINLVAHPDTLSLLKLLNALFGAATLLVLFKLLSTINGNSRLNLLLAAFAGSSWGIMRFATENETYIIPLFFSVLGSFFLAKGDSRRTLALSGLFAALATLFHQVMFFWWLGLALSLAFRRNIRNIALFLIPALIVPAAYALVAILEHGAFSISWLFRFVFADYYSGAASLEVGAKWALLLAIGVFRSFIQVHGYIGNLLAQSGWYWMAATAGITAILAGLLIGTMRLKTLRLRKTPTPWIYASIAALQLSFALLAGGNAEFLVMLPVLAAIVLAGIENISNAALGLIVSGVFIWNTGFGLIPLKYKALDGNSMVVNHIAGHPGKSAYILYSLPRIEGELSYRGIKSKAILIEHSQQGGSMADSINALLNNGYSVYTDVYNRPCTMSRESMVVDLSDIQRLLKKYRLEPCDSSSSITGKYYLHSVFLKE